MSAPRLPEGFAVQLDRRVRSLGGAALLGGSPTRLLRLSPTARGLLEGCPQPGRLEVRDAVSAELARALLDAGVAHPRPAGGPSHRDVTVVIPVRDNPAGLHRLVMSLRDLQVVIVDDGSAQPVAPFTDAPCAVEVIRHARSRGPAAARNTGLGRCATEFVAFLDSDVLPRRGWLESLLGHFSDPAVACVAPRIVALDPAGGAVARYESRSSALDMGERESPVAPYGPVSYLPSAAMVCRRSALEEVGGFDESLHCGEDVDLCWRLLDAGARLRYEPIAEVAHEHRSTPREWLSRRAFYGSSAAPLSRRHPGKTAPMVISGWAMLAWLLAGLGLRSGLAAAALAVGLSARRTGRALRGAGDRAEAVRLALRGVGGGGLQLSAALSRHYWPAALAAAALSRRARRAVLAAGVADAAHGWLTRGPAGADAPIGPLAYTALKRLDDGAYGAGLWAGAVRNRTLRPLRPDITW